MKREMKLKPVSVTAFILEVVLFWIIWFIYGYAWVHAFNMVSDVLMFIIFVGMLIIIVSAFLALIQIIRNFSSDNSKSILKKTGSVIVFFTFITIHSIMYFSFSNMGYSTAGLMNITNKQVEDGRYYFYVKSIDGGHTVELECTKDIYEKLIINKDVCYTFTYRWLTYKDDKGVLEGSIDTTNIIDNRR